MTTAGLRVQFHQDVQLREYEIGRITKQSARLPPVRQTIQAAQPARMRQLAAAVSSLACVNSQPAAAKPVGSRAAEGHKRVQLHFRAALTFDF